MVWRHPCKDLVGHGRSSDFVIVTEGIPDDFNNEEVKRIDSGGRVYHLLAMRPG